MNIDKDIEVVKDLIEYGKNMINDMEYEKPVEITISKEDIGALENLVSFAEDEGVFVISSLKKSEELEKKDKIIDLILGEYIDDRYDFQFIEPKKRADKRIELINEYKEHYRKKVQK